MTDKEALRCVLIVLTDMAQQMLGVAAVLKDSQQPALAEHLISSVKRYRGAIEELWPKASRGPATGVEL